MSLWRKARTGAAPRGEVAPTLVLPQGARIEVDAAGQLSISAPGNLVLQNSGRYGTLESVGGSIRIDRGVEVEAVHLRCAETCFVQGSLTAWKVTAKNLHLDDTARVRVMLQETGSLEVGHDRPAGRATSAPRASWSISSSASPTRSGRSPSPSSGGGKGASSLSPWSRTRCQPTLSSEPAASPPPPASLAELPEPLLFAMVFIERELEMKLHAPPAERALREILKLLQAQDLETLRHTHRLLFNRIPEPRADVKRARELVAVHYARS